MHSLFPDLLFVGSVVTPFILRLIVAGAVGALAHYHLSSRSDMFAHDLAPLFKKDATQVVKIGGYIEIALAVCLAIGIFTQAMALLAGLLFAKILFFKKRFPHFGIESKHYYWVLLILSLLVLMNGSGVLFTFDLPL